MHVPRLEIARVTKDLPTPGSLSATIDLDERLRLFGIGAGELKLAAELWAVIEPEAEAISASHWEQWSRVHGGENFVGHDHARIIALGVSYLRNRYLSVGGTEWVASAERTLAAAYEKGISLAAVMSMGDAGTRTTFAILDR